MRTEELIRLDREELEHMAKMACSSDIYYELADSISEVDEFDLIDIISKKHFKTVEQAEKHITIKLNGKVKQ